MAAGIGEASAIISVAQLGISLSKSLITYIEEVKGAPLHIQRIGNEIRTTSERLKDIGELVNQNPQTKVFSEEGINSAVRCSTECQQIIKEVKNVLCKGGWQNYSDDLQQDELDTSLFSTLRWPFAKVKLELPRAELHRIKLDLSLLFSAAMVLGASTKVEKQRLAQNIPELHKARAWAAKRVERVREMAQTRSGNSRARDVPWSDDEPEMLEEFVVFKERVFREEEEARIRERARTIQAEDDARRRKEEDSQREIERKAVEEYKKSQEEQETRSAEKRDKFRKELERLGLEPAQIDVVMESSNLDFQVASGMALVPEVRPNSFPREISGEQEATPSATSGWSRRNLSWRKVTDQDSDVRIARRKSEVPAGGLPKRVSFAGEVDEESGIESGVNAARDHSLPRDTQDLRDRIAKLEEKRNGLRLYDRERIADLNDMIDYLRDQLKSNATQSSALNTSSFYDERETEAVRSESTRAPPVVIYEERIPNPSRRDDIIIENERYGWGRSPSHSPPPVPRVPNNPDEIALPSSLRHATREGLGSTERDSRPGRQDYEREQRVREYPAYRPWAGQTGGREEEDIIVRYRDRDRFSPPRQRGWQEYSRPSRQDSFDPPEGPIIIRRERSWERLKPRPGRPSRGMSGETDYYDNSERQIMTNDRFRPRRTYKREEERRSLENREIVIRRDESPQPRPRDRQYFSDSGSEYSYNGSRLRRGQPLVGASGQSKALVLRAGASSRPYDYVRERVLNGGIRVRRDDDVGSPSRESAVLQHVRRPSQPRTPRRGSYRDQSWGPSLRRRLSETWHGFDSSENEESEYPSIKRVDSEINNQKTELSDAEVIAQTLKQFTTIQDSEMPITGISAHPTDTQRASEAANGPSALKYPSRAPSGPERKRSSPVSGRKAHFEQDNEHSQPDQDEQNKATNVPSQPTDEGPYLDKISEEPDVMNEDNDVPHHQRFVYFPERPTPSRPQQRPFTFASDLDHHSREASPRPRSRDSDFDSPSIRPAILVDHNGYNSPSEEEVPNHAGQEEEDVEVENIRPISLNPNEVDG